MGACSFFVIAEGLTAEGAFHRARDAAQFERGHGGYTGTIAEKYDFEVVATQVLTDDSARALASQMLWDCDPRIDDKWGPAGAIQLQGNRWAFFGNASS